MHRRASGHCRPEHRVLRKQKTKNSRSGDGAQALSKEVGKNIIARESPSKKESSGDCRVKMRAGDFSECVDHRENDEAKSEGDSHMRDGSIGDLVDDDGAGARKNEREGSKELSK